jgi:hypothetical protein
MITIQEIIKWSKPHPTSKYMGGNAKHSRFGNDQVEFSIVGGGRGLYGDFKNTFEVAIIDKQTNDFITNFFHHSSDMSIPYMSSNEVEELVNSVIKREKLSVEG